MTSTWERPGYSFTPADVSSLPISYFGDPDVHARESASMFRPGHGMLYLGHEFMLPGKGHRKADGDDRVMLTRDDDGTIRAVANLCTHTLRPLVDGPEFVDRSCITCPYHQWSFRRDGSLIGGRDISFGSGDEAEATKQRLSLPSFEVLNWNGFLFAVDPARRDEFAADLDRVSADFAERGLSEHLDFDGWTLFASEDTPLRADWKAFMEVFGDCYHVPSYHAGLASFSDCDTLEWTFGQNFHLQFLDLHAERGARSSEYAAWVRGLEQYHAARGETMGDFAVAWLGIYPNVMIELYAGLRVISLVLPTGPDTHVNRVHYLVPADMEHRVPGLAATMRTAFDETGDEDCHMVETRHTGVLAARSLGFDVEPYWVNVTGSAPEAGTAHFYDWYRRTLSR